MNEIQQKRIVYPTPEGGVAMDDWLAKVAEIKARFPEGSA